MKTIKAFCLLLGLWLLQAEILPAQQTMGRIERFFADAPDFVFEGLAEFLPDSTEGGELFARDLRLECLYSRESDAYENRLPLYVTKRDIKNGYLSLASPSDGAGVFVEMCYWNCPEGGRLVGIVLTQWAMCCESDEYWFFRVEGEEWTEVTGNVIPFLSWEDFYGAEIDNQVEAVFPPEIPYDLRLPQEGKDIRVSIDPGSLEYDMSPEQYEEYGLEMQKRSFLLKWNDCMFERVDQ